MARAMVRANAARFPAVQLLVNDRNCGFGWTYRRGVDRATRDYIVMVHGDNAWGAGTLQIFPALRRRGHHHRLHARHVAVPPLARTVASKTFTPLVNLITRRRRATTTASNPSGRCAEVLRIQSTGFGFQAEVLVKALARTQTLIEVPMDLTERTAGKSKAFRWKNVKDVGSTLWRLWRLEEGHAGKDADVRA